jgi:nuclease S1
MQRARIRRVYYRSLARLLIAVALLLTIACTDAHAWGCDGHRAIVFIAERLLPSATLARVTATLAASPIDPALKRFCDPDPTDTVADSATWADDVRDNDATTAAWHFIDVPRGSTLSTLNISTVCRRGNCIVDAIRSQFRVLTTSRDPASKGKALRFLLHLIGDLHQPLHAITNGDRGGNCLPVTYFNRAPEESPNGDFSPNLHAVWDTSTIRSMMATRGHSNARALAAHIVAEHPLPVAIPPQAPTSSVLIAWTQQAHFIGQTVAYARLSRKIAIEPASAAHLSSCAANHEVGHRMLSKREVIDAAYEQASIPAIVGQLRLAGIRLAAVLKAAYR